MFDPLETLKKYISFPSVSTDPAYGEGMQGARDFLTQLFESMGLEVEVVKTPLHPIILAKRVGKPEWPHVVVYGHYDVQPADPFELWDSDPFEPTVLGHHLYARGSADNKGPFMVHVSAVAQLLNENPDIPLRITFMVEGEEEMGSPSFAGFLDAYKDTALKADMILLSDTSSPSSDQIAITTGLRGLVGLEVFLKGPKMDLHSGVHGGAVYNPVQALVELCASLHDEAGRVNIPGFYDAVVDPEDWEREEVNKVPTTEAEYKAFLGVKDFYTMKGFSPFEAVRFAPTLDFNGISGGYQGEGSKTIIPAQASIKITMRLVPDQDPQTIAELLKKTLQERCPKGVEISFGKPEGGAAYRVLPPFKSGKEENSVLAKAFKGADRAIEDVFGKKPLYLAEGGSIPIIAKIKDVTGLDCLMLGLSTVESNWHAPNENFDLEMMDKAIQVSKQTLKACCS
tara:strand:+ start:1863 stop:3227 length:1365 start_codon:yes stop_codon:yes gene_type:complete